jgi:hypothetical protein
LTDEDGDYSDWIEIHNPGRYAISLAGYAFTDDPNLPDKWRFPAITIESQGYLIVFASNKDRKAGPLHTNFKLKRQGEFLGLYHILQARYVDTITLSDIEDHQNFPAQLADVTYGRRQPSDGPLGSVHSGYLSQPTPGEANASTFLWAGLTKPVVFSRERGFYEQAFKLSLTAPTPGSTIRYTTDGTLPGETNGQIYTTPIEIQKTTLLRAVALTPGYRPSPPTTQTFIFLEDVLAQAGRPPGFPQFWGGYQGAPAGADYEMDPELVRDPDFRNDLVVSLKAIPTVSLVTDLQSFHDLYANPRRRGRAWERPVSVEIIDPSGRRPGIQVDAGLRIQGGLGRSENIPKHAFRLFFRREYGVAKLQYPLFPDSPVEAFDTVVLRSGVNRSYAGFPDRTDDIRQTTYTRDEWLRASQLAMSGSGSRGIFVHLYLNGLYWGLYNLVERPDESFLSAYFGGPKEDWHAITHAETVSHSSDRFRALHQLAAEGHLEDSEKYAVIQSYLDIPHFIDYLIVNWYSGNLDWAFNNWYAGTRRTSEPVRYFVWDGERTWYEGAEIYMALDEYESQPNLVNPLLAALLANADFRTLLADRLYKHLFNDGALSEANAGARWLQINSEIEQAIIAESARWGDARTEPPLTKADWLRARDDVLNQMAGNADRLIAQAREAGYYPPIDPPGFNLPGDQTSEQFMVAMSTPANGEVYFTTDGSDPRRQQTGTISPQAERYTEPVLITTTTKIKARALVDGDWSALNEAVFGPSLKSGLRLQITEIMFNPSGGNNYEFLELKNTGQDSLKLGGAFFEGIDYTFPPTHPALAPNEVIILAANRVAFSERYPNVALAGEYSGRLSNKGEKITLKNAAGQVLLAVQYDDERGWPLSADGSGDSLVLIYLDGDPNDPGNWRASAARNGSPGTVDDGR